MRAVHHNNINALRFIAAFMVIFSHSFPLTGNALPDVFGASIGAIAVDIFFVLSGYLIAKSWNNDSSVWRYFLRRFYRIFPALLVIILLTMFVLGPLVTDLSLGAYFSDPDTYAYIVNAFFIRRDFLPGVFTENPFPNAVNGSLWTLTVEVFMYVLIPIIYSIAVRIRKRKPVVVIVLLLCACLHAVFLAIDFYSRFSGAFATMAFESARLGSYFFAGTFFYEFQLEKRISVQWSSVALLLVVIFGSTDFVMAPMFLVVLIPVAIFPFAICDDPILGSLFTRDDFSYGIYIYAFPVQQTIAMCFKTSISPWAMFFASGLITLIFAFLSWHLIEKRMLSLCKTLTARHRDQTGNRSL